MPVHIINPNNFKVTLPNNAGELYFNHTFPSAKAKILAESRIIAVELLIHQWISRSLELGDYNLVGLGAFLVRGLKQLKADLTTDA